VTPFNSNIYIPIANLQLLELLWLNAQYFSQPKQSFNQHELDENYQHVFPSYQNNKRFKTDQLYAVHGSKVVPANLTAQTIETI
jgi:hypothetical protein